MSATGSRPGAPYGRAQTAILDATESLLAQRPLHAIRRSLEDWLALCCSHGALIRAVSEEWPHDAELRELWFAVLAVVTDGTAQVIRRARKRGQAPPGADPEALAACLMWSYERVLHIALIGEAEGLPGLDVMIEPLSQMVMGGIFGQTLHGAQEPPA